MDNTLISGKRHLFAYCITDGALDDMSEEQRTALILDITEIKEEMLRCVPKKKKIIIFFSSRETR
ncbi:MAG: hypothetical protein IKU63_08960 [Bacteroidaceae bacterium]|nr:hypothetical protein [Bacteroidaceae bacterium]